MAPHTGFLCRLRDKLNRWIAFHLPWGVVYHALIRGWANATSGEYSDQDATKVTIDRVVGLWARSKND